MAVERKYSRERRLFVQRGISIMSELLVSCWVERDYSEVE